MNFVDLGKQFAQTYYPTFESGKENVLKFFAVSFVHLGTVKARPMTYNIMNKFSDNKKLDLHRRL